jgi:rare lipoprotein A
VLNFAAEGPKWNSPATRLEVALALVFCATGCLHHRKAAAPSAQVVPAPPAAAPAPAAPSARVVTAPAAAPPHAAAVPIVQGEEGIASWYGHPYHGRRAASGEIYDMYDMTAAHRTLPFGTEVRVHDLENGREVDVRINDRGPFIEGRIIDLSYAAAQAMGMPGVARVRLEIQGAVATAEPGIFAVQVGAFRDPANAERLKARIEASYGPVVVLSFDRGDGLFYRVRVGHEGSESAARELARKLREANLTTETFVVRAN